jgi:prophage antirepressor-like protein
MSLANYSSFVCDGAYDVDVILKDGAPWFKASDVTKVLGYANGPQAISHNVKGKYTSTREQLCLTGGVSGGPGVGVYGVDTSQDQGIYAVDAPQNGRREPQAASLYISEPGLYALILKSKKAEAENFQDWVVGTVLPAIRAQGSYQGKKPTGQQLSLLNEFDLHAKVVDFIRKYHSEAIICAGLGENQVTEKMRIDSFRKGYQRGQPDLLLLNKHKKYTGFALELKSPTGWGVLSPDQQKYLERLREAGYLTLVSNEYDEIVIKVGEYFRDIRIYCTHCGRWMSRKHSH